MSDSKDVSLKDAIRRFQQTFKYLLSKWVIIVIVGIVCGLLGLLYAFNAKPKYSATLNFVLSNSSPSDGGSLMGLASQFGLDLGSSGDNVFSGDNIITLMKSRRMVQQALFKTPEGSNQTLLNIFVKVYKLNDAWQSKARLKSAYPFPETADKMTLIQDSLAGAVCSGIQKRLLDVSKPDKNQGIYEVTTVSKNEIFSYYLTKYLVDATSSFYISTKTSTASQNLKMLQHEADSIRGVLGGAITLAGSQTDFTFNLNPAYQVKRSGAEQSQLTATALGQAYGQVLQNLEIAKITLQKETPLYQIIDEPILPLEAKKPGKLISLIVGGFIGGILICGLLIFLKIYKTLT